MAEEAHKRKQNRNQWTFLQVLIQLSKQFSHKNFFEKENPQNLTECLQPAHPAQPAVWWRQPLTWLMMFHPALDLDCDDYLAVQKKMRKRGLRWLHRHGHLDDQAVHTMDIRLN